METSRIRADALNLWLAGDDLDSHPGMMPMHGGGRDSTETFQTDLSDSVEGWPRSLPNVCQRANVC
jgi:hypothetical protein